MYDTDGTIFLGVTIVFFRGVTNLDGAFEVT